MNEIKRLWDSVAPLLKTLPLLIGGLCLLVHIAHIGRFPEDVQLGEGVLLYFISCGFVVVYAVYWLGLTATGLWLLRWPMELLRFIPHRARANSPGYLPTDFRSMWEFPVWFLALLSIALFVWAYRVQHLDLLVYGMLVVSQGVLGGVLLVIRRRLRFEESGLSLAPERDRKTSDIGVRLFSRIVLGVWLLLPLMLGHNQGTIVEGAFAFAQIRKLHATVHVAVPWNSRLTQAGLVKQPSFLGANYARFDNVTVSHMSIGSRVAIEIPGAGKRPLQVYIPRASIEVE